MGSTNDSSESEFITADIWMSHRPAPVGQGVPLRLLHANPKDWVILIIARQIEDFHAMNTCIRFRHFCFCIQNIYYFE